jgi:ligand-binding sensor domain-containing protein
MSVRALQWIILMALLPAFATAQDYSYRHYDIQQGLANSTVYCMLQDKQGFLWFGTETGVSRFDGTQFRTFTTIQGLPDNQVLQMFEDSKGRIWMAPFNKSVCYYYKGKIYNQNNDSLLRNIKPTGHAVSFAEDKEGNILIHAENRLHLITGDRHITVFNALSLAYFDHFLAIGSSLNGRFHVVVNKKLFEIRNRRLVLLKKLDLAFPSIRFASVRGGAIAWLSNINEIVATNQTGEHRMTTFVGNLQKLTLINDSIVAANSQTGAIICNINSGTRRTFLPNESISTSYRDKEGNWWFCTLGHGVFMLNSEFISNHSLINPRGVRMGAFSLAKYGSGWMVGSDMVSLFSIPKERDTAEFLYTLQPGNFPERVMSLSVGRDGSALMWTDGRMDSISPDMKLAAGFHGMTVKSTQRFGNKVLVATGRDVVWYDLVRFKPIDTVWYERATTAFKRNDSIFIGTLDGLVTVLPGGATIESRNQPLPFQGRITDMKQSGDGLLWIATYSGIYAFDGKNIVSATSEATGLVSNICRTMAVYKNELWVGTDKGLQKIDIADPLHPKAGLILDNELASNIINTVLADSTTVAVGTPEGVSIFDKTKVAFSSGVDLYIDNIMVSGKKIEWLVNTPIHLSNKNNNIRFEYGGISYRSGGDIRYDYRLVGLDSSWRQTRQNYLDYPTLPGGDYKLQLQAINKFDVKSQPMTISFSIEKKLWQKTWFQVLALVISLLGIWLLLSWRIRVIRREEASKNNIRKKIASLEQLALKSQMNPHFIFNSLNSIQHYVLDKDIEGANKFISGFSRLIRQTLDISTRHEISIAEEMSYLSTYLQLEKIRLENKFSFDVTTDPSIDPDEVFIPPMILQPFVENCVRHGIRYRQDNDGKITIVFKKFGSFMNCEIEDNGVGRKIALSQKSKNPIEYQSKGISLTIDRIELLNKHAARPISIHIYDLEDGNGVGTGTRVIISFPLELTDYLES